MAKLFNRAKMTTTTTGTGTITLGSASNGFQSFADAGVANGDVVQYVIEEGSNFEIGTGTYSSSGTTLTRSPTESSNSDAAITLAGQATVSITATHADFSRLQHNGTDKVTVSATGASVTGNISVTGTVDGRDIATDGSKLDGIAASANNYSLPLSSSSTRGGVKIGYTENGKNYPVELSSEKMFVNVPWTDTNTTYSQATSSTLGLVKIGYAENGKNYPVELSSGKMFVNVPWTDTDTNTTYTAGSGLSLSGTTFSHSDTSTQTSVNNSGRTYIQDITLDTYGHITGITSATETVTNTDTTYSAGSGLSLSGTTFSHTDTSTQASVNNSNGTVIQDVTLDTYGHITGIGSVNLDSRYVNATGDTVSGDLTVTGGNALICDGVDSGNPAAGSNDLRVSGYGIIGNRGTLYVTNGGGVVQIGTGSTHNAAPQVTVGTGYVTFAGDLNIPDQIIHSGDSDTYMQFHSADQWRVVVGGTERLEVKNSSPHVLVSGDLNSTSDARLKENVEPITNALSDITQLEGVSFDWRDTGTRGHGFIAQQVEPILPNVVQTDDETGIKSINYVGMIGHLVEAIKELKAEIEELKR